MKKTLKGFTLIELLVVIAIIGILSSVVLASLNTARSKGANAAVKSNLANMRAQAELDYDSWGSSFIPPSPGVLDSTGVCSLANSMFVTDTVIGSAITQAQTAEGGTAGKCYSTASNFTISIPLKTPEGSNTWWCVDDSGNSRGASAAASSATACP